ncbi:SRPBCC family protein [Mucilaginibacter segetis]|uniref:SRPBCC domain-containing protein n=1 Tax=Mucilaginibacter segetis TaxID=2793071 RepID=A0A934ULS1_9SPHI|nr:SRPBCC domain-containing protein [Mucilaginibacter segetis]MBK0378669.1 SRPBCC domain-containing protein [Mucilaginibacter segetis]
METQPLIVERVLNAPVDKVWEALTDNEKMKQWYFKLENFEAKVGFEFSFFGQGREGEKYKHNCRITAVEHEKKLSYTWAYDGYEGISEVSFELFPDGDKTLVKITHTGLHSFPKHPDFATSSFSQGWNHILGISLKNFVEQE